MGVTEYVSKDNTKILTVEVFLHNVFLIKNHNVYGGGAHLRYELTLTYTETIIDNK